MKAALVLVEALFAVLSLAGQTAPLPRGFDVASVRRSMGDAQFTMSEDAGRISYTNVALMIVVMRAYHLKYRQIEGPEWLGTEHYDIAAKMPDGATKDEVPPLLQALLAERFKLTAHTEAKMMPGYALIPGKSGPKMKPAGAEEGVRRSPGPKGPQIKGKTAMAKLADVLSDSLDRPVVDMTGLNGFFEVELSWAPEQSAKIEPSGSGQPAANDVPPVNEASSGPSIFTALQEELGLKLEPRKTPLNFLVIDHAEKLPTAN